MMTTTLSHHHPFFYNYNATKTSLCNPSSTPLNAAHLPAIHFSSAHNSKPLYFTFYGLPPTAPPPAPKPHGSLAQPNSLPTGPTTSPTTYCPSPLLNSYHALSLFFKELLLVLKKNTFSFPNSSPTLTVFKCSPSHNPSHRPQPTSPALTKASIRHFSSLPTKNVRLTRPHPAHHLTSHHALHLTLITFHPTTESS